MERKDYFFTFRLKRKYRDELRRFSRALELAESEIARRCIEVGLPHFQNIKLPGAADAD